MRHPKLLLFLLAICLIGAKVTVTQSCSPAAMLSIPIDSPTKTAIIDSLSKAIQDRYVFPDKAEDVSRHIRNRNNIGAYDNIATTDAFAKSLTQNLRSYCSDLHFTVMTSSIGSKASFCTPIGNDITALRRMNYGLTTVQILPGNVGYLEFSSCIDAKIGGATAAAAMKFLSGVDALIIDVRSNTGGVTSMGLLLSSYLFDLSHFKTQKQIDGQRLLDIPVYILTGSMTASSAECFAYDLKHHGRATIIGQSTAGAGHCAEISTFEFDTFLLSVMVPTFQPIHPVTGSNWEGSGVEPDIKVAAIDALEVAHAEALKHLKVEPLVASAKACNPNPNQYAPGKADVPGTKWQASKANEKAITLTPEQLKAYTGVFGPRTVTFEDGSLFYEREGVPKLRLIPIGNDLFNLEGVVGFQLQFERDSDGRINRLAGLYDNGDMDSFIRIE
jgi:hypothetical protein